MTTDVGTVTHGTGDGVTTTTTQQTTEAGPPKRVDSPPKRFHGTVTLDATRVGRDASRVAEEVIAHLTGLVGANLGCAVSGGFGSQNAVRAAYFHGFL